MIAFYQAGRDRRWREFSNFYDEKGHSFDFVLPQQLLEIAGMAEGQRKLFAPVVRCHFSEKAIMLCKAAVMGDLESYNYIVAASTPGHTKRLGRQVKPFDNDRWHAVVCGVAVAVLRQKFAIPDLAKVLLRTGGRLLCEAAPSDFNWGIGIALSNPGLWESPSLWKGSNILGWALMEVRRMMHTDTLLQTEVGKIQN